MRVRKHQARVICETALRGSWVALVCFWMAGWQVKGSETGAVAGEYQVKAVCLYNFTQFTDWPASAFAGSNAPIVIGIVGEDPFGQTMEDVVRGEVVRGHPLMVRRLRADDDFRGCHILFFSHSEKKRLPELLDRLKTKAVLSVGEDDGFAEDGGMINLIVVNKTVQIEINQAAAEHAGLQISSKLLKLAHRVLNNPHN
jgi:YfiR/HmsC-like